MDLFMDIITYFGINLVEQAETFPQLLQNFMYSAFAMYIMVCIFRAFANASWKISHDLGR